MAIPILLKRSRSAAVRWWRGADNGDDGGRDGEIPQWKQKGENPRVAQVSRPERSKGCATGSRDISAFSLCARLSILSASPLGEYALCRISREIGVGLPVPLMLFLFFFLLFSLSPAHRLRLCVRLWLSCVPFTATCVCCGKACGAIGKANVDRPARPIDGSGMKSVIEEVYFFSLSSCTCVCSRG